ncbi:MAG: hypothetical protein WCY88_03145 [Spongiibacteraceae bacterium]
MAHGYRVAIKIIGLLYLLLASALSQAEAAIDIYQPSHQTAISLIKTITPLYGQRAKLSTDGQQLIIKAEPAVIDQITELLLKLDHPKKLFRVEISSNPNQSGSKTLSTKPHSSLQQTFTVSENTNLILSKTQTTSQLNSRWLQIQNMPADQEFLQLNIQSADATVYINFTLQRISNGRRSSISNQINGTLSRWIPVTNAEPIQDNIRRWNTTQTTIDRLYIKVTPAN